MNNSELKPYTLPDTQQPTVTPDTVQDQISNLKGEIVLQQGKMQSANYQKDVQGWKLTPTSGEFNFPISVDAIDIPDTTTAASFHVDNDGDTWWGATAFANAVASISKAGAAIFSSITTIDPIIIDTLTAAENITAGDVVMVLPDGTVAKASSEDIETIPRHYGIATTTATVGTTVKVQKTGPYTTSGLTAGKFYGATTAQGTEAITIDQTTGGSFYDAVLGVGQSYTTTKTFTTGISLHLSSPLGTGSYGYTLYAYPIWASEGGPSRNTIYDTTSYTASSVTRSGTTARFNSSGLPAPQIGWYAYISGANETEYNGWKKITAVSGNTWFEYTVSGTPATPATGTITVKFRPYYKVSSGNVSITGTGDNFIRFNFSTDPFEWPGEKVMFEFNATTAGQLNIEYSNSSVYSGGDLFLSGVVDTTKDLNFRIREAFGGGVLGQLNDTFQSSVNAYASGHPSIVSYSSFTDGRYAAASAIGLAKSSTVLLLGNYPRN